MWSWKFWAWSAMVLVVWISIKRVQGTNLGRDMPTLPAAGWGRNPLVLKSEVLCHRRIDLELLRRLLANGSVTIDTFCKGVSASGRNGRRRGRKGRRMLLPEEIKDESRPMPPVKSQDCLSGRVWEMLRGLLLSASPKSTFGWCDTEIGWSLQHRLNLTLPLRIMTLPLTQVIYEEKVGLQFEGSVEKESLERVRLQGIFLVFFLGDKEKDWLRTEGSQFRLTVSKGRWFKYMPVCVAGDSKYLVVELPAKARRWLHARSFQLSVRITPLIAQETNGMLASGQTMTIREAGDCPESLLKKLLFGWDEKQYTRVPPVIFGLLEGGRNTKASGCAAREFREADNEGSLKTKEEKIRKNAKLGKRD